MARINDIKVGRLSANFESLVKRIERIADESIVELEKDLHQEIIDGTPQDTGQLVNSYKVTRNDRKLVDNVVEYTLSFGPVKGDHGENYAALVHEWPEQKNWTKPGTGPKFLQKPVYSRAKELIGILVKNFRAKVQ